MVEQEIGERVVGAALALLGVPYRRFGRDPATGLDCVGLVVCAHAGAGITATAVPDRYRWRDVDGSTIDRWLRAAGCVAVSDKAAGDILVQAMPGGQMHMLIVASDDLFIHAHAGLGRVVAMPGPVMGTPTGRWRNRSTFTGS